MGASAADGLAPLGDPWEPGGAARPDRLARATVPHRPHRTSLKAPWAWRHSANPPSPLASSEEVAAAAAVARAHGRIGIDTEFMSEGRYRALLCLVQIAVDDDGADDGPHILLIDPLETAST